MLLQEGRRKYLNFSCYARMIFSLCLFDNLFYCGSSKSTPFPIIVYVTSWDKTSHMLQKIK